MVKSMEFKKLKILRLLRSIVFRQMLSSLVFFVTARCNAKCGFCFYKKNANDKELTIDEIAKISKNVGQIYEVLLSGGEPFLRDDILEIGELFAKNNKIIHLNIPTNGFLGEKIYNVVEELCKRIYPTEISLMISIDNLGKKHDEIRGIPGLFERATFLARNLVSLQNNNSNLRVGVITTLLKSNQEYIKSVIDYVRNELGISYICLNYPRGKMQEPQLAEVAPSVYWDMVKYLFQHEYQQFKYDLTINNICNAIDLARYETVYKTLINHQPTYSCRAGENIIVIDETGNVYPCELLDWKLGNLRENGYNLKEILWRNKTLYQKKIKKIKCYCTWECATHWNMLYSFKSYFNFWRKFLWNIHQKRC
jgi:radical SAM protein with 4Fe4S-binding SPASM domain